MGTTTRDREAGSATNRAREERWPRLTFRGGKNRIVYLRHDPTSLIAWLLVASLLYLVIAPVVAMISDAVVVHFGEQQDIGRGVGEFTTYYLERVFASPISEFLFWDPLVRTVVVGLGVCAIALVLGGILAWLVVRTDLPGRRWLSTGLVVPYMLPSWTFAVAWMTLFKNRRQGGPSGWMESLGFAPPDWLAYGAFPIIVTLALHYFPFAFLLFGNALQSQDSQLEESAKVLGASRLRALIRITAPLTLPAMMSALLLIFSRAIGTFGTPYILGTPTNYTVLSTSLYSNFSSGNSGEVAVLAAVIVALGMSVMLLDLWLLREYKRFVTVGGKGHMHRPDRLGRLRWPIGIGVFAIFAISTLVPLAVLVMSTLMISPGVFSFDNFTLQYWLGSSIPEAPGMTGLLQNSQLFAVAWNSLRVVLAAALICGVVGMLVGYCVTRLPGTRVAAFLRHTSFLPYLVPSIGFAAAYLSLFAIRRGPIPPLYGSLTLVVIVMAVAYLPYASRAGITAMMQLGRDPEEAAMISGARWRVRLTRIILPMQKSALATAILLPFISGMKELSLVIMLATPGTELLTTQVLRYLGYNYDQLANGLVVIIVLLIFVITYGAQKLTGSKLAKGLQG